MPTESPCGCPVERLPTVTRPARVGFQIAYVGGFLLGVLGTAKIVRHLCGPR
jgi:hypothetical protein